MFYLAALFLFLLTTVYLSFKLNSLLQKRLLSFFKKDSISFPILLVTSHPDDETMFFSPTIQSLLNTLYTFSFIQNINKTDYELDGSENLYLLCLSNGNESGWGKKRQEELQNAATHLRINDNNIFIIDHPDFQDGSDPWSHDKLSDVLDRFCRKYGIRTILTFDHYGISGHSNHIDVSKGVELFCQRFSSSSNVGPLSVYQLESCSLWRKYLSIFAYWFTLFESLCTAKKEKKQRKNAQDSYKMINEATENGQLKRRKGPENNNTAEKTIIDEQNEQEEVEYLYFANTPSDYLRAINAMFQHQSQLLWFRYLYIAFSGYMFTNKLKKYK